MSGPRKVIRDLFTERDNETHDLARYLAAAALICGMGLETYAVLRGQAFDVQAFGVGLGGLFGGVGVALKLKKDSGDA